MRKILKTAILLFSLLTSCSSAHITKIRPEYTGVDSRVQSLVDEYFLVSKQYGKVFSRQVTIGFKKINTGAVVGICTYGLGWREIDLDLEYWNQRDHFERLALVFHELSHCYCGRDHDWGMGEAYPEELQQRIDKALNWLKVGGPRPGYYDDGCPFSLLYPTVVEKDCVATHYGDYIEEMFNRCEPY